MFTFKATLYGLFNTNNEISYAIIIERPIQTLWVNSGYDILNQVGIVYLHSGINSPHCIMRKATSSYIRNIITN